MIGVDLDARRCTSARRPRVDDLAYDHLVVAAGATDQHVRHPRRRPSTASRSTTLADAVRLRNHVLERFEAADADPRWSTTARSPSWSSAAARPASRWPARWPSCSTWSCAGTSGTLDVGRARVVLVEMQDHLLAPVQPGVAGATPARRSRSRGVEVRTGAQVAGCAPTRSRFADGEELAAHTLDLGGRRPGQPAGRGARAGDRPGRAHRRRARPAPSPATPACGPSATSPRSSTPTADGRAAARSSRRSPSSRAATSPAQICCIARRAGPTAARSATATRARWPPSAAAGPSPSCRSASAARLPGLAGLARPAPGACWPGSATASRCSPTGPGTG